MAIVRKFGMRICAWFFLVSLIISGLGSIAEAEGTAYPVGDVIRFGSYEQDNNYYNGKEDIKWIVIGAEGKNVQMGLSFDAFFS